MTLTLGCEVCPDSKAITLPSIGGLILENAVDVPYSLLLDIDCKIQPGRGRFHLSGLSVIAVGETCEGECLHKDAIGSWHRSLSASETFLDAQVSRPTFIFNKEGNVNIERS